MSLLETGKTILETLNDMCSDGTDPTAALDDYGLTNADMLALMWATGTVRDAFAAVLEDIEQAIVEG